MDSILYISTRLEDETSGDNRCKFFNGKILLRVYSIAKEIYNLSVILHERQPRCSSHHFELSIAFANILWKQS